MKRFLNRLRGRRGETLVETMAAILVFTLASIMLLSMVSSANDIDFTVKDARASYEEQLLAVEKQDSGADSTQPGTVTIDWDGQTLTQTVEVYMGGSEEDSFYSYALPREAD